MRDVGAILDAHYLNREENKSVQLSAQPRRDVLRRFREYSCNINWLGFLDTFRTLCIDPKGEIRSLFEELRAQ